MREEINNIGTVGLDEYEQARCHVHRILQVVSGMNLHEPEPERIIRPCRRHCSKTRSGRLDNWYKYIKKRRILRNAYQLSKLQHDSRLRWWVQPWPATQLLLTEEILFKLLALELCFSRKLKVPLEWTRWLCLVWARTLPNTEWVTARIHLNHHWWSQSLLFTSQSDIPCSHWAKAFELLY